MIIKKININISNGSLVIAVKLQAMWKFHTTAILLFFVI
jgi:hypothetical protein